jgi:hypothetical protein
MNGLRSQLGFNNPNMPVDALTLERRARLARRRPAWEARKTILQNRLEELLVFEINLAGQREYRNMVGKVWTGRTRFRSYMVTFYSLFQGVTRPMACILESSLSPPSLHSVCLTMFSSSILDLTRAIQLRPYGNRHQASSPNSWNTPVKRWNQAIYERSVLPNEQVRFFDRTIIQIAKLWTSGFSFE